MRLLSLFSLPAVLSVISAIAIERRDADFYSVRTHMHKDMSGRKGDPKAKYFHESVFHPHYDGRFADKQLGYRERKATLSNLIQTYLATFEDIGVETWLMHGTLLGWWWNRKILPWDSDSDVQVSESSMHFLASYYNMTVFHYKTPRIPEGRDYMLEVNPHYSNREQTDKMNVIDARWVDTTSGLFIDITTARYNLTHPAGEGMLSCKDGHEYRDTYIFPLRETIFEGTPAKIPFAYKEVLEAEYQKKALTVTDFEGHHFDDQKMEWMPVPKEIDIAAEMKKSATKEQLKLAADKAKSKPKSVTSKAKELPKTEPHTSIDKSPPSSLHLPNVTPAAKPLVKSDPASEPAEKAPARLFVEQQMPALERQKLEKAEKKMTSNEEKKAAKIQKEETQRKAAEAKAAAAEQRRG